MKNKSRIVIPAIVCFLAISVLIVDRCKPLIYNQVVPDFDQVGVRMVIRNDLIGYIDNDDQVVVEPQYIYASRFIQEAAVVVRKDGKYGQIRPDGSIAIPFMYSNLECFNSFDLALAKRDSLWGWIDKNNDIRIPFIYRYVNWDFGHNGLVSLTKDGIHYGVINIKGETVIPFIYDEICEIPSYWEAGRVRKDSLWGLVSYDGVWVLPLEYDCINDCEYNVYPVKKQRRWGLFHAKEHKIIYSDYDSIGHFRAGLAVVYHCGKYGYINEQGDVQIPFCYDKAWDFDVYTNEARVSIGNRSFCIDNQGDIIKQRSKNYFFGIKIE